MKRTFAMLGSAVLAPGLLLAQVRETPATLALVEGGNPQGYIQNANNEGVFFATTPGGSAQLVPYARIRGEGLDKLIRLEERTEVLGGPRALFAAGQYTEAAEAFGKVAKDYAIIFALPQNFASEALFYQLESLKRAGQYAAMVPIVSSPPAATISTKLAEVYKRPFEFHKLWALHGKNDNAELKTALEAYQEPVTGDQKLLPAANFRILPPNEIAQLSFLRAKVFESEGAKDRALEDYYRTFTLAYGNDVLLAKLAMGAAMVIQQQDPALAKESRSATTQMQSIAYLYSKRFGKEGMPPQFQKYAVLPELPKPPAPEEAAAEGDGAAKPEGAEGEEKDEEAKPEGEAKAE